MASPTTADELIRKAGEVARAGDANGSGASDSLVSAAGGDRQLLEAARDKVAARLHGRADDWDATAALTMLNRALSRMPRTDPLDWRVRWAHHRKP